MSTQYLLCYTWFVINYIKTINTQCRAYRVFKIWTGRRCSLLYRFWFYLIWTNLQYDWQMHVIRYIHVNSCKFPYNTWLCKYEFVWKANCMCNERLNNKNIFWDCTILNRFIEIKLITNYELWLFHIAYTWMLDKKKLVRWFEYHKKVSHYGWSTW